MEEEDAYGGRHCAAQNVSGHLRKIRFEYELDEKAQENTGNEGCGSVHKVPVEKHREAPGAQGRCKDLYRPGAVRGIPDILKLFPDLLKSVHSLRDLTGKLVYGNYLRQIGAMYGNVLHFGKKPAFTVLSRGEDTVGQDEEVLIIHAEGCGNTLHGILDPEYLGTVFKHYPSGLHADKQHGADLISFFHDCLF